MEERKVTVYRGSTKDYAPVPRITLQGQWLDSLGFSIGDRLTVGCERGRIEGFSRISDYYNHNDLGREGGVGYGGNGICGM
ncbi:MAG: type I toxin-antitoxin system SymE family toxin [Eubacterium sp.]|nr:type I toxin-antitoxin system SymE family toxin [Eubacterium sp.]